MSAHLNGQKIEGNLTEEQYQYVHKKYRPYLDRFESSLAPNMVYKLIAQDLEHVIGEGRIPTVLMQVFRAPKVGESFKAENVISTFALGIL